MTTTIEYSQMLDEIAKSADWHESLDSVSISRINQAAQRLRHLDLVAKEYDELVRHMDAGGDFTAFMVSKSFKEST